MIRSTMQTDVGVEDMEQSEDIAHPSATATIDATVSATSLDEQQQEAASIEQQLAEHPTQYDLHAQLLRLLRSLHEIDSLRTARQRMADLFPLTSDLWQEWLDDDTQRIDSHDDQMRLLALHQRACKDYLVPQLWIRYVQYAEQLLYSADEQQWGDEEDGRQDSGVSRMRAVYNEAAQAMGAHRLDGEKLWRGYRKFEVAVLTRLLQLKQQREDERDSMDDDKEAEEEQDASDEEDTEEEERDVAQVMKQLDRIKSLYRRCLALPLNGLEQAYNEYRQFVAQQGYEVEDDIATTFRQAKAHREARTPYEKALQHTEPSSAAPTGIITAEELSAWYTYIQFEHQQSAKRRPARVAVLYERALAESFLHTEMWSAYTLFLEERSGRHERKEEEKRVEGEEEDEDRRDKASELLSVSQRAIRNVPHSGALWNGLIRALERRGSGQDEVMAIYRRASEALASRGGDELASVCLSVADYVHRQLRAQLQRDNRSRSRSPMRSTTTPEESKTTSSSSTTTLSLPFSRPPSKRAVITTALDLIRPVFQQAVQALRYHNPASSHPSHHNELTASVFIAYHSLERHDARDTTAARDAMEQWADIAGGEARMWVEWARAEVESGDVAYARHVYKRGLERLLLDWSAENVCWEWLRFEREHGSVDEYCAAWRRCEKLFGQFNAARSAIQQQQQQTDSTQPAEATTTAAQSNDAFAVFTDGATRDDSRTEQTQELKKSQDTERKDQRNKKRNKRDSAADSEQSKQAETERAEKTSSNKKRKMDKEKKQRKEQGARVAAVDKVVEEKKQSAGGDEKTAAEETKIDTINGAQLQRKDDGAVSAARHAASSISMAVDSAQPSTATAENTSQSLPSTKFQHVVDHPTRTLLVSNLSWITTRDTLQSLFRPYGDVDSVLLHADAASHKQYAYIVYASKDAIKAGVAAVHSHTVDGSSVEVECVAHRYKREKQLQKVAAHRSLTVLVKELQLRDDVEARLRLHFAGCCTIVRVRQPRDNKTGEVRNVAWIELADKDAYDRALQLNGSVMDGDDQPIRVVPDRPPPPRQGGSKKESDEQQAAEGQRSRLHLMPRAVQAHERDKRADVEPMVQDTNETDGLETSDASKVSATQAPPMSNNDFRAMLTRRN